MRQWFSDVYHWLFNTTYTVTIEGNRNYVNQRNCVSGGDIVGGDLYVTEREDRETNCPHCGGPI